MSGNRTGNPHKHSTTSGLFAVLNPWRPILSKCYGKPDSRPSVATTELKLRWPAPRKLVHPKWESLAKLSHGGTHEKATDHRRSSAHVARI